jgi:hypothetical protein
MTYLYKFIILGFYLYNFVSIKTTSTSKVVSQFNHDVLIPALWFFYSLNSATLNDIASTPQKYDN